jgi:hypothetical protein
MKRYLIILLGLFFTGILFGKNETPGKSLTFEHIKDFKSCIVVFCQGNYLYNLNSAAM